MKTIKLILAFALVAIFAVSCSKEKDTFAKPKVFSTIQFSVNDTAHTIIDSVQIDSVVYTAGFPLSHGQKVELPTNSTTSDLVKVRVYVSNTSDKEQITFINVSNVYRTESLDNDPDLKYVQLNMNIGLGYYSLNVIVDTKVLN